MSDHDIKNHIAVYRNVFIALLFFTVLTVLVSYIEVDATDRYIVGAVFIGLIIASVKGYLVAAHFMHLNNEKQMINWSLIITVVFFLLIRRFRPVAYFVLISFHIITAVMFPIGMFPWIMIFGTLLIFHKVTIDEIKKMYSTGQVSPCMWPFLMWPICS